MTNTTSSDPARPNIIIVICDDLGLGDLGCYGSPMVSTPALDTIAAEGVRFTTMYSGGPVCTPSRAALLTGCYGPRVNLPAVLNPRSTNGLAAQERTIAEYVGELGYATACIGKWHLGHEPEHRPGRHGFDRYFGLLYSNDMQPLPLYDDDRIVEEPADVASLTRRYHEQAVQFVREHADDPFLLYLAHTMPHEPVTPGPEFVGHSAAGPYGDAVEEIDHYFGLLMDELDELGIRENTCVIFTNDHGPWYVGGSGDLSGRKVETYEGGVRVPFLLRWPDVTPAGVVYEEPASLTDVLPTLLSFLDVRPDPSITVDGSDLSTAWSTGRAVDRGDIFYYWTDHCQAIRRGRWKLHLRRFPGPFYTGRMFHATQEMPQLFDLERDPEEAYDLAEHYPEVVERLRNRLQEFDAELKADHADRYG